jgi:hypothetical protein
MSTSLTTLYPQNNGFEDYDDFILDVCGISPSHSNSNMNMDSGNSPASNVTFDGSVKVGLEGEKHIFRHAKEVQKGSRGGYLKGN